MQFFCIYSDKEEEKGVKEKKIEQRTVGTTTTTISTSTSTATSTTTKVPTSSKIERVKKISKQPALKKAKASPIPPAHVSSLEASQSVADITASQEQVQLIPKSHDDGDVDDGHDNDHDHNESDNVDESATNVTPNGVNGHVDINAESRVAIDDLKLPLVNGNSKSDDVRKVDS